MLAQWEGKQCETLPEQLWLQLRGVGGVAMADGSGVCPFASIKSAKSLDCPSHTHHRHRRWHTHTHHRNLTHTHTQGRTHTHTQTAPTHAHQIWKGKKINPKKRKKQQNKKLNTQKKMQIRSEESEECGTRKKRKTMLKGRKGVRKGRSAVTGAEAEKICKRLHKNEIATKTQR